MQAHSNHKLAEKYKGGKKAGEEGNLKRRKRGREAYQVCCKFGAQAQATIAHKLNKCLI